MLRCQFLCHVLKALFCLKITLKLSYFCKKMQTFRALRLRPQTPSLRQLGASPPDPQTSLSHCEFLATRLAQHICIYHLQLHQYSNIKPITPGFPLSKMRIQLWKNSLINGFECYAIKKWRWV